MESPYAKKPDVRISKEEVESLKVFNRDEFLKMLRPVFKQKVLDKKIVKFIESLTEQTIEALKKVFIQDSDDNDPVFGQVDYWTKEMYGDKIGTFLSAEAKVIAVARQEAIEFIERGIERLENINGGNSEPLDIRVDLELREDFSSLPADEVKKKVVAYNEALKFLESGILTIQGYANSPDDKETNERQKKDSVK